MTDAIIRTSGDYTLNLDGRAATVTVRVYHLARATADADTNATLSLLPGGWIADATQTDPGPRPGDTLRTLVQHVASLHGALRVAGDNSTPGILKGIVLAAGTTGDVSFGPPEARDRDIAHHRTR
jgi:hypothetical protein